MKTLAIGLIKFYQKAVSPIFKAGFFGLLDCRFYPSCSEYSIRSIEKNGFLNGSLKTFFRILRCGPWNPGGLDLP